MTRSILELSMLWSVLESSHMTLQRGFEFFSKDIECISSYIIFICSMKASYGDIVFDFILFGNIYCHWAVPTWLDFLKIEDIAIKRSSLIFFLQDKLLKAFFSFSKSVSTSWL